MKQEKYRVLRLTAENGDEFAYKETHEGLMMQGSDGTWAPSWLFIDIEDVARVVENDEHEKWDWAWE